MNQQVLQKSLQTTRECVERMKDKFQIAEIDTSGNSPTGPKKTAESVCDTILGWIEQDLTEEIFHVPKPVISEIFGTRTALLASEAGAVLDAFATKGEFRSRKTVEEDSTSVQALPVVVVRNKSGDVLCLRRRELNPSNKLHEKIVFWAGGHVRREDGSNGRAIVSGALRELKEELRLNVESDELKLLGAIYADVAGKTGKHVAIVYEWRAESDDVAISLSTAEFFERRGTSLSGRFLPQSDLVEQIKSQASEVWSEEIVRELLPEHPIDKPPTDLFH